MMYKWWLHHDLLNNLAQLAVLCLWGLFGLLLLRWIKWARLLGIVLSSLMVILGVTLDVTIVTAIIQNADNRLLYQVYDYTRDLHLDAVGTSFLLIFLYVMIIRLLLTPPVKALYISMQNKTSDLLEGNG